MTLLQSFFDTFSTIVNLDTELNFQHFRDNFLYIYATDYTLVFTLKITLCLSFLIVIRGCVPRYRYDFLTKMGWVKFLGYVLTIFLISILLFLI